MAIREDQKQSVQQATDIVQLIGEQIQLRPKGKEFVGLCPFHDDKKPSLSVSPQKQIFKCFSCGTGGDVFSFAMGYHKMTFPEALRMLAERAGITLDATQQAEPGQIDARQRIAAANSQAVAFFQAMLKHADHGQTARAYIQQRGFNDQTISDFQLGYAPDSWTGLVQMIDHKHWDQPGFEQAGLISARQETGFYDRMRHRLIFPIFDAIGRPIAFGGRKLREEDEPKYLNSPETQLFNKSSTLYGIHLAKKAIIDSKVAVIVEGYTDVIAAHQAGASNVVATLGTALTREHVSQLRRFADKVVLVFDADEAGQKAADRALELFLTGDVDVAIAVLPDGLDPDALFTHDDGVARWKNLVTSAQDALTYQFARMQEQLDSAQTLSGSQHLAEAFITRLAQLGLARAGSLRRTLMIRKLAKLLGMSEPAVNDLLQQRTAQIAPIRQPAQSAQPLPAATPPQDDGPDADIYESDIANPITRSRLKAVEKAERQIIGVLIAHNQLWATELPDGRQIAEALPPIEMLSTDHRRLYQSIYDRLAAGQSVELAPFLSALAMSEQQPLANVATQADAEVERLTGGLLEIAQSLLVSAVQCIGDYHRERKYSQERNALTQLDSTQGIEQEDSVALLKRLVENRKANPSPVRIARIRL